MTYARSHLTNPAGGVYHVHSRCVRRAWLCGSDPISGNDFSHRRTWLEQRFIELADIYAVAVHAYAIMSNHYHLVIEMRPSVCASWSDEEVAERWLKVCPGRASANKAYAASRAALIADAERLTTLRKRLGSLSWFMGHINEPLARLANKEDECTGRFWEGRFKSQLLLDDPAVLSAMVYVDLNPVRAGIADNEADCHFTSVRHRCITQSHDTRLVPINRVDGTAIPAMTLASYLQVLRWTAEQQSGVKRGIMSELPDWFTRMEIQAEQWLDQFLPRPGCWQRAVGAENMLKDYAASIGQRWIRTNRSAPINT